MAPTTASSREVGGEIVHWVVMLSMGDPMNILLVMTRGRSEVDGVDVLL